MKIVMACALVLACGGLAARPNEEVVKPGANIDRVAMLMTAAGYGETMLAFQPGDEGHEFRMWDVGEGF